MLSIRNSMICWEPKSDQIEVAPWPDASGRYSSRNGWCAQGANEARLFELDDTAVGLLLFVLFNTLVVRDEISVGVVHEAFCGIKEYRDDLA